MRVVGGLSLGMREKVILLAGWQKQLILGVTPDALKPCTFWRAMIACSRKKQCLRLPKPACAKIAASDKSPPLSHSQSGQS